MLLPRSPAPPSFLSLSALSALYSLGLLLALAANTTLPGTANAQSFQGIGILSGGAIPASSANAVSGDGNVVVGSSTASTGTRAIVWTALGGLGALNPGTGSTVGDTALGVDFDGDVVGGFASTFRLTDPMNPTSGLLFGSAHLWLAGVLTSISGLDPGGPSGGWANDLTSDGTVAVGRDNESFTAPFGDGPSKAFRRFSNGQIFSLGLLPGYVESEATGIAGDGSVIVGFSEVGFTSEAFRWTLAIGLEGLGILPNTALFPGSRASGISADGSAIVGTTSSSGVSGGAEGFRWTQAANMVGLGTFTGFTGSTANAASGDASRIVGSVTLIDFVNPPVEVAAIHDDAFDAYYPLQPILEAHLGSLGGWQLEKATGISDDGTVIVGDGVNPSGQDEGWIATLPVPEPSGGLAFGVLFLTWTSKRRLRTRASRAARSAWPSFRSTWSSAASSGARASGDRRRSGDRRG